MFHLPLKRTYNLLLLGGLFHKCQLSQLVQIFYIIAVIIFLYAIFYSLYAKLFLCCFILLLLCYAVQIFSITDILSI